MNAAHTPLWEKWLPLTRQCRKTGSIVLRAITPRLKNFRLLENASIRMIFASVKLGYTLSGRQETAHFTVRIESIFVIIDKSVRKSQTLN